MEPKEIMALGAIRKGAKKFDKIKKETGIEAEELNKILEKLEENGLIRVETKKGLFGQKVEIFATEKGEKEIDAKIESLQQDWNQMSVLMKSGDKQKLRSYLDDNRSILPMMMFFGIMDIMIFSTMLSLIGSQMNDYVPAEDIPPGTEAGDSGEGADMGDGGFDIDIGF